MDTSILHPVGMLYYSFARCYHWGNLVKGTGDPSARFFTQVNLQSSQKKTFTILDFFTWNDFWAPAQSEWCKVLLLMT